MGIKLHGEDATKATNSQELFRELKVLDRENGKEAREFFQIEFPASETSDEERQRIFEEIRERVIKFFAAGAMVLTDIKDKKPLMRDYIPVPGQASPYFDRDDLDVLAEDIRGILDPNDAHFQAALADREVGALQLLGRTLNFAVDHGDPRAAFKLFQRMTREVRLALASDLEPMMHELTELSWEGEDEVSAKLGGNQYRKNILRARLQEMIQLDYHLKNQKLVEALRARFPKQEKLWAQLVDSYNAATFDLGVNNFKREEYLHMLFNNLVNCAKQMNRGLYDALKKLSRDIRTATQAPQISDAINVFVQQTLPAIFPPSPSSSPALSPSVEPPEPAPKSS